jgi:voltage-gated potassium channel
MDIFDTDTDNGSRRRSLQQGLRRIERGDDKKAIVIASTFAVVDLAILTFFLLGPYLRSGPSYLIIDYLIAVWIAGEMTARAIAAPSLGQWIRRPMTWIDFLILGTLLFPDLLFNFAFLRVMRFWAVGRSPFVKEGLRLAGYSHHLDVVRAVINFLVFLFMVTGFVYTSFFYDREGGEGFVDALYFTVATVTTTGFGDITLPGTLGKLTSVLTMIVGISLFVRLAQAVVRPYKVTYPCHRCGLQRHDADAVHCKACGEILNIPDEGQ